MKNAKRMFAAAVAVAAVVASAGCAGGDSDAPDPGAGGETTLYIPMIAKSFQHQFWQAVKQGAEEKAAELGVTITFEGPPSEAEVEAQLQMLQTAIDKNPGAIAYAALDQQACIPLYEQAKEKGIPIVEFDAACNSDYSSSLSATDNKVAGALAAEHMAKLIGGEGKIAIVAHSQTATTSVDRVEGFTEKIEADYPDIDIVDVQYGDGDQLKSADIAKAFIGAHSDLKGIYGANEGSAIGVVNAVNELGLEKGKITIVGFDSGAAQINAIKDGTMAGAITQDPIGIGRSVVEAAYNVANGKPVEKFIDAGSYWYDAENIDDPKISALLYQ